MAANHTPSPTYPFKEATPCNRAWFSGPSTAAAASTASSHVCAQPSRAVQLRTTPHTASTATRPAQDQEWASTASRELPLGAGAKVVRSNPPRYALPPSSAPTVISTARVISNVAQRRAATLHPDGIEVSSASNSTTRSNGIDEYAAALATASALPAAIIQPIPLPPSLALTTHQA